MIFTNVREGLHPTNAAGHRLAQGDNLSASVYCRDVAPLHSKGAAGHPLGPLTLLGDLAGNKQQVAQQLLLALRGLGQLGQAVALLWND